MRSMGSWGPKLSSCRQWRFWSDWANARADLSLRWAHMPFCGFIHALAQMSVYSAFGFQPHQWNITIERSNKVFHALTFVRTWWMLMHWKIIFDRYYCIKTGNICYISRYFLYYFVSLFHRCLANVISTDCVPSRAGQYTSRDGSHSVAPVQAYWKLRSRALTARELTCKYTPFAG